jgi:hypothetical protein
MIQARAAVGALVWCAVDDGTRYAFLSRATGGANADRRESMRISVGGVLRACGVSHNAEGAFGVT